MPLLFLHNRKYEWLLSALILHLFSGIIIHNMFFYQAILCTENMVVLGLAGFGVFAGKQKWKKALQYILFLPVLLLPFGAHTFRHIPAYFLVLSIVYIVFFVFLFSEVILFLIKPGYINVDLISAAACGYFLLIEISTFLCEACFYQNRAAFKGIDTAYNSTIYNDLVYFSSITITSIGFGDITPGLYYTKLLTAFIGIIGHFYSVVLVGIVIGKFVSKGDTTKE